MLTARSRVFTQLFHESTLVKALPTDLYRFLVQLVSIADSSGRVKYDPGDMAVLFELSREDVVQVLRVLDEVKLIVLYIQQEKGIRAIQLVGWGTLYDKPQGVREPCSRFEPVPHDMLPPEEPYVPGDDEGVRLQDEIGRIFNYRTNIQLLTRARERIWQDFEVEVDYRGNRKPAGIPIPNGMKRLDVSAVRVLHHLNELLPAEDVQLCVESNLKPVRQRLRQYGEAMCLDVVTFLVARWGGDAKMAKYLNPRTIFRASKFAKYAVQANARAALLKKQRLRDAKLEAMRSTSHIPGSPDYIPDAVYWEDFAKRCEAKAEMPKISAKLREKMLTLAIDARAGRLKRENVA